MSTFVTSRRSNIVQLACSEGRWLATGLNGGFHRADAAYNMTVPDGWDRRDLLTYRNERLEAAGFEAPGPSLFTGVDVTHARGARLDSVTVIATTGLSNPAALPAASTGERSSANGSDADSETIGTVNLLVGSTHALTEGTLATLLSVVTEAKAATLLRRVGFPGTTTDAVVVGCDPTGEPATFAGSATAVGGAARACVREALEAGLAARYTDDSPPASVAAAEHGTSTDRRATVFEP
ncbi:MAG: adenosylcobinamide amidohydrolase [Halobacteriales archaeon]